MTKHIDQAAAEVVRAGWEVVWFGRSSADQVKNLETLLDLHLSPSFREFLEVYGGGGVVGADISGIEADDASKEMGGYLAG